MSSERDNLAANEFIARTLNYAESFVDKDFRSFIVDFSLKNLTINQELLL